MWLSTLSAMADPFPGSEALAAGLMTPYELRTRYTALHKDVYAPKDAELTALLRAKAAWLRSRRRGILAGFSASAMHGSKWIDPALAAAIIDTNRSPSTGVEVWEERIGAYEIAVVEGMPVTTPARTALDLARRCRIGASYVGRRRLMSSAASAANANTSAPSRTQPTLASPLMVS